jgi:hypothetical protein
MVDETTSEQTDGTTETGTTTATEEAPKVRKDIVPPEYRKRYAELGGTCGDFIAAEISAMMESGGIDSLNTVKVENDIPKAKWSGLNNGQQRMNLSNTLRAAFLRGETIKIAGKEHNLNALRDEFGKLDPVDAKSTAKFLEFCSMPTTDRNIAAIKRVFHDLPEKGRLRAEREANREKAKADKAAAAEAKKKADAEAKAAAAAATPATDGAAAPAKKTRAKKADKVTEPA